MQWETPCQAASSVCSAHECSALQTDWWWLAPGKLGGWYTRSILYIYIYIVIINYNIYIYIYMRGETPSLSLAKLPWNWSRSIATNLQKIPENGWPQFPNLHHFTNLQKIMQNQNTNQYHPKYTFGAVRCVRRQRQPLPSSWLAPRMEHFFRMKTVSLQRRCALPVAGVRVPTRSE